ncbi:hypothetical protein MHH81_20815 [Psychrobacillus sp. FSL H8-0484]|uniref:hypothetical protein n=1 Tax=Psychrobacillus sp. FSL H8-0484 TaxID=2921390 RepID=UPI0030F6117B
MGKVLLWVILLYPLLWGIDFLADAELLSAYHSFWMKWWEIGLVLVISYYVVQKMPKFRNEILEQLRINQYFEEVRRYRNTPYISPLMAMYLISPPIAYSPYDLDYVKNTFYRTIVNTFRDRVYVLSDYKNAQPSERKPYYQIVGFKMIAQFIFYFGLSFGWLAYWVIKDYSVLIVEWQLFSLPFVIYGLSKSTMLLQAIMEHLPSRLDRKIERETVNGENINWRDAFPDRPFGETIIRAYYSEKEKRMRYFYAATNQPVPATTATFRHEALPPYPFPTKIVPEWANDIEELYEAKKHEWNNPKKVSNVVPLRRRSK